MTCEQDPPASGRGIICTRIVRLGPADHARSVIRGSRPHTDRDGVHAVRAHRADALLRLLQARVAPICSHGSRATPATSRRGYEPKMNVTPNAVALKDD
jgi:hypothetical protein